MFDNLKKAMSQNKLVVGASALILTTASQAAVDYDVATGFSGALDMTAYTTAVPIVITVLGIIIATTLGIRALKGAKSA